MSNTEADAPPSITNQVLGIVQTVQIDVAVIKAALPGIADHETRIRALERRVWMIFGGLALLVAGGNYLQLIFNR